MRDSNNGAFEIYDIAGNQLTNEVSMGQVGAEWSVAGIAADPSGSANARTRAGCGVLRTGQWSPRRKRTPERGDGTAEFSRPARCSSPHTNLI